MSLARLLEATAPRDGLLLLLLDAGLKSLVLLVLAGILALALRGRDARLRTALWTAALAGALVVPPLSLWMPGFSLPALRAPVSAAVTSASVESEPSVEIALPVRRARFESAPTRSAAAAPAASREGRAVTPAATPKPGRRWTEALVPLWLAGLLATAFWSALGLVRARGLARRAVPPGERWARELDEARHASGVTAPVRLLTSDQARAPMTWGFSRPVILLPASSHAWSADRRRVVLLHELAHIRRGDWLARMLAAAACAVYWFNPLAWIAARRLAAEQERACDDEVLALGTRPSAYAGHLLAIARTATPRIAPPLPALDMARRSQMEGRLMSILDDNRGARRTRALVLPTILITLGLVPAVAAVQPWMSEAGAVAPWSTAVDGAGAAGVGPAVETAGVERVLGELVAIEARLEPFQTELEGLEAEMEPIEAELELYEAEMMVPFEAEGEALEAELGPFEARAEEIERELEPFEERLESIEAEMEQVEARLEGIEPELEPYEEQLEALEREMEPFDRMFDEVEREMEPLYDELERLGAEIEAQAAGGEIDPDLMDRLHRSMAEVHEQLGPFNDRMADLQQQLEPIHERMQVAHEAMVPVHERMEGMHEEMRPYLERMEQVHREMEPVFERMSEIHREMEPVYERMAAMHERMEPIHQQMAAHHERMEPFHQRMTEVHRRMEPVHEEMEAKHAELEAELTAMFEGILVAELGPVARPGADFTAAARRITDSVGIQVHGGRMTVRSSPAELRQILTGSLGPEGTPGAGFEAAVERAVRAISELEVSVGD